jgi:hypothetical protein
MIKLWHRKMRFSMKKRSVGRLYIIGNRGYTLNRNEVEFGAKRINIVVARKQKGKKL